MTFGRLLVANRGEIAVRVFRTCRRLGIETVAVVAPDDRGSLHARVADTVIEVASYLDAAEHLRAAVASGADAVHPGYGFLAESPELAEAVAAAGCSWIGPPAGALRLGGDKLAAKRIAVSAGVPTLPQGTAAEVGLPLLVKAAAGGGGRGMRVVREQNELADALEAAAREAAAAFGDGTVFCERYLERPRHIEVQVLADAYGNVHPLGLRDCSIQRRHQKVVEESPPPGLSPTLAARLAQAAVTFCAAIGYESAGTAEFLVDEDELYFLELNGRIQVEHTVTEAALGIDLVELQLRVAGGERLPPTMDTTTAHAIEARLYAEHPRTFLPQAGRIEGLRLPSSIRVDSGVEQGDEVGTAYDPMIAKLIASGGTRTEALDRLAAALAATEVDGVTTNLPFLRWLIAHPAFRGGRLSTAFLVDFPPLSRVPQRLPEGPFRHAWRLNLPAPAPAAPADAEAAAASHGHPLAERSVTAPMPGTVLRVDVAVGDAVDARQPLLVLDAMKMEMPVLAPFAATVAAVHVSSGDGVAGGDVLVELQP
jgi:acetyl/propionyl-CoA carboxylase alpha subunit